MKNWIGASLLAEFKMLVASERVSRTVHFAFLPKTDKGTVALHDPPPLFICLLPNKAGEVTVSANGTGERKRPREAGIQSRPCFFEGMRSRLSVTLANCHAARPVT